MNDQIDAVYKVGSVPHWGEFEELRYSLRSLAKNFANLRHAWIIGPKFPSWADPHKLHWIQATDPYKHNKDANLINKMISLAHQSW